MDTFEKIFRLRKQKKISQSEMAEKLHYKTPAGYGQIENGKSPMTIEKFVEICKILEVDSYDSILPPLPNAKSEIEEDLLIGGRAAFKLIRQHALYLRKEIEGFTEKLQTSETVDKEKLLKDLEFYVNFLRIIEAESFKYSSKFTDRLTVILHEPLIEE